MKRRVMFWLFGISDRLCWLGIHGTPTADGGFQIHPRRGVYRLTFEAGHWIGELGWRLRDDA